MFELRFEIKPGAPEKMELVRCLLRNLGVKEEEIVEDRQKSGTKISYYTSSAALFSRLKKSARSLRLKGVIFSAISLRDSDWKTRWKKYFKPFYITPDIVIIPAWIKQPAAKRFPRAQRVLIDTSIAFGSGLHATTRMMAQLIRARKCRLGRFLDIGTGSGILTVIAGRYAAKELCAFDIDPAAVKTASLNFKLNQCRVESLKTASVEDFNGGTFDFVAANLITEDLVRFKKKLISLPKKNGYLAVSGIFKDNYAFFRKRFASSSLVCVRVLRRNDWHAALFRKR